MTRKLIRDHLRKPERGDYCIMPDSAEHWVFLHAKLHEELAELALTDYQDPYEYGDAIEVLITMAKLKGVSFDDIIAAMDEKRERRGGFLGGVVLNDANK